MLKLSHAYLCFPWPCASCSLALGHFDEEDFYAFDYFTIAKIWYKVLLYAILVFENH